MTRAEKLTFPIDGIRCDGCVAVIENAAMRLAGVEYVGVSLSGGTMTVRPGPGLDTERLMMIVAGLGYGVNGRKMEGADCPCRGYKRRS